MAGLFDFLDSDEGRLGMQLLGAGGYMPGRVGTGQRIASAMQGFQAQRDGDMRRQLLKSQIDENSSQDALRRQQIQLAMRKQALDEQFMGIGGAGAASAAPSGGVQSSPVGMSTPGAGAPGGGFTAAQISQQFGIPIEAVLADYKFNGGKKIAELIDSRTKPNWVSQNGNTFNTNAPGFAGGIQDQVIASPNGSVGVLRGGARPSFNLVPGSVGALTQLEDAKNESGARFQPGKGVIGSTGRPMPTSVLEDLGGERTLPGRALSAVPGITGAAGPTNAAERGMAADVAQVQIDPAREAAQVREMLSTPGAIRDPGDRAQATTYLQRLESQLPPSGGRPVSGPGGGRGYVNPPAADGTGIGIAGGTDFSPVEKAAQDAQRAGLVKRAEAEVELQNAPRRLGNKIAEKQAEVDVVPTAEKAKALDSANVALGVIDKALKHPGLGAATGLQGLVDPRNYVPGTDARNFRVVLDQLKGSAFLTAFEKLKGGGAITEVEGAKAEAAIARLNRAQSTSEFREALGDYKAILNNGIARMKEGSAPPSEVPKRQLVDTLPPAGQYKGRRARDTTTGQWLVSNGMQWKPE